MTPSATITRTTEAPAILTPPRRRNGPWLWIIPSCPFCGSRHTHGAGRDGNRSGSRVAHCTTSSPKPSYRLTPITEANAA
ncbi:hypothetical protein ITP53_16540 [Nonomuraea sp. K274]|uniref:Uncharacterized protein n=1 Tax=Nonomuraea cypriaca TaxID=1187855 RepID=A0A931F0N8_9ACTN|nr:hypothetical protein [Nonomuraea cypriaca]MBF8187311.1 hypothetical protein [Nonomuraea cypriaca]